MFFFLSPKNCDNNRNIVAMVGHLLLQFALGLPRNLLHIHSNLQKDRNRKILPK